ncbi:hypothetical protein EDB84DRAFT_1497229, partial [Lactarius hengduanensis]
MATQDSQDTSFLQRARQFFLILGGIYVFLVALGTTPFLTTFSLIYMHNLRLPPFAQYDMPEKYDLARDFFKTHNVRIHTADNETLGAWFTFSDPFYTANKASLLASPSSSPDPSLPLPPPTSTRTSATLSARTRRCFLHGNGGTRALRSRVQHYQAFASRLRANVLAPDYRGLSLDALAAWDWLRAHGAVPENVLIVGNSLVRQRAAEMQELERGGEPQRAARGRVLATFSSVETLLDTYYIAGLIPMLAPPHIPFHFVKRFLVHRFDSLSKIVSLRSAVIVHSEDDWDIPHVHSESSSTPSSSRHLPHSGVHRCDGGRVGGVAERMTALAQERAALRTRARRGARYGALGRAEVFARTRHME